MLQMKNVGFDGAVGRKTVHVLSRVNLSLPARGRVLITRTNRVADPGSTWNLDDLWAALGDKVDEPASEGTSGQALMTDGNGNRYWGNAPSSGAAGSVIVDGDVYSLRTGSTGAAGYLTFVEES